MNRLKLFLILLISAIVVTLVADYNNRTSQTKYVDSEEVRQILLKKKKQIDNDFIRLENILSDSSSIEKLFRDFAKNIRDNGIDYGVIEDNEFIFWSDNKIPYNKIISNFSPGIHNLINGWYWIHKKDYERYTIFGFILIKKNYSYENKYINDKFQEDFGLPSEAEIVFEPSKGVQVKDHRGEYLFSIEPEKYRPEKTNAFSVAGYGYVLIFIFLLFFLHELIRKKSRTSLRWIWFLAAVLLLFIIRYITVSFGVPAALYRFPAFDPVYYASSSFIPSLGDLMLLLSSIWFILFLFNRFYLSKGPYFNAGKTGKYSMHILLALVNIGWFIFSHYLIYSLIYNSSISITLYNFFNVTVYSLFALFSIFLVLVNYFLLLHAFVRWVSFYSDRKIFLYGFIIPTIILSVPAFFIIYPIQIVTLFFFLSACFLFVLFVLKYPLLHYTRNVLVIFLSVLFLTYFTEYHTDKKEKQKRRILVTNLENERDRTGEYLLSGIEAKINEDEVLQDYMKSHLENEPNIYDYLQNEYFNGYFRKYDLQVSVCDSVDELEVYQENATEIYHCYSFFEEMLQEEGIPLSNSNFYFLDNLNGRISYIGLIHYKNGKEGKTLYISLDSKLTNTQLGYPELLLDKELAQPGPLNEYTYAKYKSTQLIRRSGDYDFPMELTSVFKTQKKYTFTNVGGYNHLIYNADENTTILISKSNRDFLDLLAQFAYIFALFYLIFILFVFFLDFPGNVRRFNYNFKNKIKLSMILLLFLSLIAVGTVTVYYTSQQFRNKQKESISEKLQSIIVELDSKLGMEAQLYQNYEPYLTQLLTKFSNVFYIDMNLYDLDGNLLASSRPQIFDKGLMSRRMNPEAFKELAIHNQPKFIHTESIGEMKYHSAYVPFYNVDGYKLAYLNLPYFTKQQALQEEIYTIVMVMVNIYVFLIILGTIVAVFVSNNITRPLRLIQQKMRKVGLGQTNEKIEYQSHDEVGELISEYNRMVDELEENARKLAQTERESAWREMAKQIAHEIKNPLTPMKLKVQYLKRAWDDKVDNFDERMKQFTQSMISQINTLSDIATEFSNFAKMPRAKNEKISINEQAKGIVQLFENTENVTVRLEDYTGKTLYVYADQDQIGRVLNNLVKNGIQSIPKTRKGQVKIGLKSADHKVLIIITDNGAGIPDNIKDKLFAPNFTTKSGGMGMGLAISKKIIEDTGGRIWYETRVNEGTTFFIELPIYDLT